MQLVAVDEAAGGDVPDLRVVLPAVPEPAHRFDVVGGLVEEVDDHLPQGGAVQVLEAERGQLTAAEVRGLVLTRRHLHPYARAAGAHIVEGGDRLGDMERLRVGGHHGRNQSYVAGEGGDAGGDQDGVQPSAYLVRAAVGTGDLRGLEAERVLDGHEVEQAALGLGDQIRPVCGGEQITGAGHRLAPGGRMPKPAPSSATARCRASEEEGEEGEEGAEAEVPGSGEGDDEDTKGVPS